MVKKGYFKADKEKSLFTITSIGEECLTYVWDDVKIPGMASLSTVVIVEGPIDGKEKGKQGKVR